MSPSYVTRSSIETYQECPRRWWFMFHYGGRGIMPIGEFVPLSTGGAIHHSIEQINSTGEIKNSIDSATLEYETLITERGYHLLSEEQGLYTLNEQSALIEALSYAWALREYPHIQENYDLVSVEKEYQVPISKDGSIVLLSRPDALLRNKSDGSLVVYSIKSMKRWYERSEKAYKVDLQGFTEALAVTMVTGEMVEATKFCFLIKGAREKQIQQRLVDGEIVEVENWVTDSPLIYGWKRENPIQFAHSNRTIKPENKSGFGKLTPMKEWSRFPAWEIKGGTAKWIETLAAGRLQPELGDVLKEHVITPVEVFRKKADLRATLHQIQGQQQTAFAGLHAYLNGKSIDACLPMNRRACYFPDVCPFIQVCPNGGDDYEPEVAEDPIGTGEFMPRLPHYETERKALDV